MPSHHFEVPLSRSPSGEWCVEVDEEPIADAALADSLNYTAVHMGQILPKSVILDAWTFWDLECRVERWGYEGAYLSWASPRCTINLRPEGVEAAERVFAGSKWERRGM
jgi:hypothetical protein